METNVQIESPILLRFNRKIRISEKDVLISPRISGFEVRVKGKEIAIKSLRLEKDRTYLITLGPSLQDQFGSTPSKPLQLIFSTGDSISNSSLSGYVVGPDLIPKESVIVGLFEHFSMEFSDTVSPIYFTTTDKNGLFILRGFPDNIEKFVLIAFADPDRSLLLSTKKEGRGFGSCEGMKDNCVIFLTDAQRNNIKEIRRDREGFYEIEFQMGLI